MAASLNFSLKLAGVQLRSFALSGPDNVGKTTNLRLLAAQAPNVEVRFGIESYHPDWPAVVKGGWWFHDSSDDEHIDFLFDAFRRRSEGPSSSRCLALDRGPHMLAAVCAATRQVKNPDESVEEALDYVYRRTRPLFDESAVIELLLLPTGNVREIAALALAKESSILDSRYVGYQKSLAEVLLLQVDQKRYSKVLTFGSLPIVDVQNEVRKYMSAAVGEHVPTMFDSLDTLFLIGGLSESGKSTAARILSTRHHVHRMKFEYLSLVERQRMGMTSHDYYSQNDSAIAESMLLALDDYLRVHYFYKHVSLESLHRLGVAQAFKAALGGRARILYVDAPGQLRAARSLESSDSIRLRDEQKMERGAEKVARLADITLDNRGDLFALEMALAREMGRHHERVALPSDAASPAALPDAIRDLLVRLRQRFAETSSNVVYACATGSIAADRWVAAWSDIDVVVLVSLFDEADFDSIRQEIEHASGSPKIALSILLVEEVECGLVPGEIVNKLRRMGESSIFVLLHRMTLSIPYYSLRRDAAASIGDLFQAVLYLRRALVTGRADVQRMFKTAGVVAKILLRIGFQMDFESEEDAIFELVARSGGKGDEPKPTKQQMAGKQEEFRPTVTALAARIVRIYESVHHR